jgi:serine/threonine-protein kinase RsbW
MKPDSLEINIPSRLGAEKKAMEEASRVAREMGFSEDRIEDLKTAVAEACVNAIEHGNQLRESTTVGITLSTNENALTISVHDNGTGTEKFPTPDMDAKILRQEPSRGWGVFLIHNLMDKVSFESIKDVGNVVHMVIHLDKDDATP